ncbi:ATP adenylyltransferase family protein [Paraburkholderia sp. J94]|uniref:ATP adenylyltransferase family protein n=1 Tax=Paraburkholderia sp. J94 TaxID=2805441 RepID=UPI002AB0F43F|nr:phosphorylase [Paraburkholderia sp. J94]
MTSTPLTAATLRAALDAQTRHALQCGALKPIETVLTHLDEGGVRFAVRQVSSLARKEMARRTEVSQGNAPAAPRRNPFLPCEDDLCVGALTPTHLALLNKYNVIDDHLLIVTRRFVPQEALLDRDDFTALLVALRGFDALGFYNGGEAAGASQLHKHLQAVPLPLDARGPAVPMEVLWPSAQMESGLARVPNLPFAHAFATLDLLQGSADDAAHDAWQTYRALLDAIGIGAIDVDGLAHQRAPYNLLVTRRWMLMVPRAQERVEGISINALGFAGSLFVRDAQQCDTLAQIGPMTALARVASAR